MFHIAGASLSDLGISRIIAKVRQLTCLGECLFSNFFSLFFPRIRIAAKRRISMSRNFFFKYIYIYHNSVTNHDTQYKCLSKSISSLLKQKLILTVACNRFELTTRLTGINTLNVLLLGFILPST